MPGITVFRLSSSARPAKARVKTPLRVKVTAKFAATPEEIFPVIGDLAKIARYMPLLRQVSIAHRAADGSCGAGSERVCTLPYGMGTITQRIVEWDPPSGLSYRAWSSRLPMREHFSEIVVQPYAKNRTRVEWRHYFDTRFWPLGWIFPLIMKRVSRVALTNIAADMGVNVDFV